MFLSGIGGGVLVQWCYILYVGFYILTSYSLYISGGLFSLSLTLIQNLSLFSLDSQLFLLCFTEAVNCLYHHCVNSLHERFRWKYFCFFWQ